MSSTFVRSTRAALAATRPHYETLTFDPATLDGLPAPARRLLGTALPAGVPLSSTIELQMQGEIKLGRRWLWFSADQILQAGVGFVWTPTVGNRFLRFTGADVLGADEARVEFRLHGLVPVVRASGPDVARSAAGRLAAETVAWVPQALTPQAGAVWNGIDEDRATVTLGAAGEDVEVEVAVDADGQLVSLGLQRWKDSAKPPTHVAFGGVVHGHFTADNGVRIADGGTVGWDWGGPRQGAGEFFHYTVTAARFLEPPTISSDSTGPA